MATTNDILPNYDPLYGQKVEDLNEHDRRQYEEWLARRRGARVMDVTKPPEGAIDPYILSRPERNAYLLTQLRLLQDKARQLNDVQIRNQRAQRQRSRSLAITAAALRPLYLVFIGGLAVAITADIFSVLQTIFVHVPVFGWVFDLLSGGFEVLFVTPFIALALHHLNVMGRLTDRVRRHRQEAQREYDRLVARLRSLLPGAQSPAEPGLTTYRARVVLNSLFVMLLEQIPYVEVGPWLTLRVGSAFVRHHTMYRRSRIAVLACQDLHRRIQRLEDLEVSLASERVQQNMTEALGELTAYELGPAT